MIPVIDWNEVSRRRTLFGRKLPPVLWAARVLVVYGWRNAVLGATFALGLSSAILHPSLVTIAIPVLTGLLVLDYGVRVQKHVKEFTEASRG